MADGDLAGPPPKEAVDYLRRKGVRTGFSFQDVWREEHGMAFTVAKMMNMDMLHHVQRSLVEAGRNGTTKEEWSRQMTQYLSKQGWWGRKEVVDPKDGKKVVAQLGSSRRLDTIWRVNMGQAAQAGVWERGQRSTSHPYILYRVGPSKRHRDQHLAWDGVLLPKDDPFWAVANPRNGWGCKCYTRFVSAAQHRRYVAGGIPGPAAGDGDAPKMKAVKTERPKLREMTYRNTRTGKAHGGYAGIDPGFEHNPGVSRQRQLRTQWQDRDAIFAQDMRPNPKAAPVRDALEIEPAAAKSQRAAALEAVRAIERVHGDGQLPTIPVHETNRNYYGSFVWDSKTGTAKRINLSTHGADEWPALTMAHEVGHFLDHSGISGRPSANQSDWESATESTAEVRAVMDAIRASGTYALLGNSSPYFRDPCELWARAYAQHAAWRSGSSRLKGQLDKILTDDDPHVRVRQWPYDEFLPIAESIDRLLMAKGWARRKLP